MLTKENISSLYGRPSGQAISYWSYCEGVNGVNRLATKGEKYYWLPTKRVKNYRLPTGKILTNYRHGLTLSSCFQRKEHFAFFSGRWEVTSLNLWLIRWSNRKNFLFCWYGYITTTNIIITEATPQRCYRLYKCYWRDKGEKLTPVSCLGRKVVSVFSSGRG